MIGSKVKISKNIFGNECEPFLGLTGVIVEPFRTGCRKKGWVGVFLDSDTIYGRKFNFELSELEILQNELSGTERQ
jgi:hypothetical protein